MRRARTQFYCDRGGGASPPAAILAWTSDTATRDPQFSMTQIQSGDLAELQIDDDPAFGSTYADDTHTIAALEAVDGQYNTSGVPTLAAGITYYARSRYKRGGIGAWSAWSNTVSKTMDAASPTHLVAGTGATGAGTDRSQYINTSGSPVLTFACNADVGAACLVRSVDVPPNQSHYEMTAAALAAAGSKLLIGVSDAALALGPAVVSYPGQTGAGCTLRAIGNSTSWVLFANGSNSAVTAPNALAVGDIIACEFNKTTNVVTFKAKRAGTTTLIGSVTLTSNIPANWTATVGADASNTDSGTCNFGGSPVSSANFAVAPTAGYSGW